MYPTRNFKIEPCPILDEKNKVIMFFSLKGGSRFLTKMFFANMGLSPNRSNMFRRGFNRRSGISEAHIASPDYFKFKVVRNPYIRVVSTYLETIRHWNFGTFKEFLEKLEGVDLTTCNSHWKFQCLEDPAIFNKIVKLENISEEIKEINALTRCNYKINYTKSGTKKFNIDEFVGEKNIRGTKIPHYKYFYNNELAEKVGKIFKRDIEAFNYQFSF